MTAQYFNSTRPTKHVLAFAGLFLVICGIAWGSGVRYNHTESYPLGFWMLSDDYKAGDKGQLVIFCPGTEKVFSEAKERGYLSDGYCGSGIAPLLKKVIAVEGDQVVITRSGISVNGEFVAGSQPFSKDALGRDLPFKETNLILANAQVVLYSDYHSRSFDSRYFGVVDGGQIEGVITPVWTWEGGSHE